MKNNGLDHPVVIITGASYGIGAAAALMAANQGAYVVLAARTRADLDNVADQIKQRGGTALVVEGDLSRYEDCKNVVQQTLEEFGRIDALVNNAAIIGPLGLLGDVSVDEWTQTMVVNVFGPVMMCKEAIPHLRKTNGSVVNISSGAGEVAIPTASAYCASKAALTHFSRVLAVEEPSLTIVALDPGPVNTHMQAEIREKGRTDAFEDIHQYWVDQYEQGKLLSPEIPALTITTLALCAPHEWTGEILQWDEQRLQDLIRREGG